jgi:hypothetical protein
MVKCVNANFRNKAINRGALMQTAIQENIIMIVPQLLPVIDGVGDYSLNLAKQLHQCAGLKTTFIVADPDWHGDSMIDGFSVHVLTTRSSAALTNTLTMLADLSTMVILQFSGYGYARHALCVWLVTALRQWKTQQSNASLLIMFHELFIQPGHLLSKDFWIHTLQKKIVADLVTISDGLMTNADVHVSGLNALRRSPKILKLPIPSNMGEPRSVPLICDRINQLVIFGQVGTRQRAYQNAFHSLQLICDQLNIDTIIDIGTLIELRFQKIGAAKVVQMGELPEAQISQILSESKVAFLDYGDSRYLAKSGVFAAYCAHGMVPIVSQSSALRLDDLHSGQNYLAFDARCSRLCDFSSLQDIANAAYAWYQTHNIDVQTQTIASAIKALNHFR